MRRAKITTIVETMTPAQVKEHVGRRIREVRIKSGTTQCDLAAELKLTFQTISCWEKGINAVSLADLIKIGQALDIDFRTFLKDLPRS